MGIGLGITPHHNSITKITKKKKKLALEDHSQTICDMQRGENNSSHDKD